MEDSGFSNLLCAGAIFGGVAIRLHTLWRERTSIITHEESLNQNLFAAFLVFMGVGLSGDRFPLVERGDNFIIGLPAFLLWASVLFAAISALIFAFYLRRFPQCNAPLMGVLCFPLFFVFGIGIFMLLNGLPDRSEAQLQRTRVIGKEFHPGSGKSQPSYRLFLASGPSSHNQVKLKTNHQLFRKSDVGDEIELQTRRGALRMEWLEAVRRVDQP